MNDAERLQVVSPAEGTPPDSQPYLRSVSSGTLDYDNVAPPRTDDAALRTQLDVLCELGGWGATIGGWKLAFTSPPERARLGQSSAAYGYLLRSNRQESAATLDVSSIRRCRIEPELFSRSAAASPAHPCSTRFGPPSPVSRRRLRSIPTGTPTGPRLTR